MSGVVAAAVAVTVGTAYSINRQRSANKNQRRANQAQERLQRARQVRENQQAVRQRRAAAAQVMARSEAMGVAGSSGEAGAISSIGAQTAGSIGHAGMQRGIGAQISAFNQAAATAAGQAQLGQTIAGLGGQMLGADGLHGAFEKAFQKMGGR